MKNKKGFAKSINIILCTLIILFICFLGYRAYKAILKNNGNDIEKNINKNVDSAMIQELIPFIPFSMNTLGLYKDAYNGTMTTVDDISSMILSSAVVGRYQDSYTAKNGNSEEIMKLLKENNIDRAVVFLYDDVNEFLMKRYNTNLSMLDNSADSIKVISLNDKYLTFVMDSIDASKLNKVSINYYAYEVNEDIIMMEKAVFVVLDNNKYYVYKNSNINDEQDAIKVYDYTSEDGKILSIDDITKKIKDDLVNYTSQYKHTFKKNNMGYYWYSTEFIE